MKREKPQNFPSAAFDVVAMAASALSSAGYRVVVYDEG
jgi:hypothetical protein